MNYLTKFLILVLILFSKVTSSNDNKIIFKINEKIFTNIDFEKRLLYLETLNSKNFEEDLDNALMDDYFSSILFHEYIKNNNKLNNILKIESDKLYDQIIVENAEITNVINKEVIKKKI